MVINYPYWSPDHLAPLPGEKVSKNSVRITKKERGMGEKTEEIKDGKGDRFLLTFPSFRGFWKKEKGKKKQVEPFFYSHGPRGESNTPFCSFFPFLFPFSSPQLPAFDVSPLKKHSE